MNLVIWLGTLLFCCGRFRQLEMIVCKMTSDRHSTKLGRLRKAIGSNGMKQINNKKVVDLDHQLQLLSILTEKNRRLVG